jgi:4-hydroxy-tetrahydrodipicolinate reductase
MAVNIIIHGACGRMGREIGRIVLATSEFKLVGCIEARGYTLQGRDFGEICGAGPCGVTVTADINALPLEQSVVIDFTAPEATDGLLKAVGKRPARFVIGTTGFSQPEIDKIHSLAKKTAVVFSPNMSLGVNLLFYLTQEVGKRLGKTFDIEIIEAHHRFKKDSPSGTARHLGEIAAAGLGLTYDQAIRNGRNGIVGERSDREIGMHAVRGGDIVGDHTVLFAGNGERLELRHMAHNRTPLAQGAVSAAQWVNGKAPGLYSMADVLGI